MNGPAFLFDPAVHRLGWVLLHSLWQDTAVALLLFLILPLLSRASSSCRYLVILGAFLLGPLLSVGTWLALTTNSPVPLLPVSGPHSFVGTLSAFSSSPSVSPGMVPDLLPWLVVLWLGGIVFLLLRLLHGWLFLNKICRLSSPLTDPVMQKRFDRLRQGLQLTLPVRLLTSAWIEVPLVIGWLRPVILLPSSLFLGLSVEQAEAILAHELAHIQRRDFIVNLFQTAIETLFFYHPALLWIGNQLRQEREHCCDDLALSLIQDRGLYASALAKLEEGRIYPFALAASGSSLLLRIRRLAGRKGSGHLFLPWLGLGLIPILAGGLFLIFTQVKSHSNPVAGNARKIIFVNTDLKFVVVHLGLEQNVTVGQKLTILHKKTGGISQIQVTSQEKFTAVADLIDGQINDFSIGDEVQVPEPAPASPPPKLSELERKLQDIRVGFSFTNTPLDTAINFLNAESQRLDPGPEKSGVNLILDLDSATAQSALPITLTLHDVPLNDALRYICAMAGVVYKVNASEILIEASTPPSPEEQYLNFYLQFNKAKDQETEGRKDNALAMYEDCLVQLDYLQKRYPAWETTLIHVRLKDCQEKIVLLQSDSSVLGNLPMIGRLFLQNSSPQTIRLTLTADDELLWNEEKISFPAFSSRLSLLKQTEPHPHFSIFSNNGVHFDKLMEVLTALRGAGIVHVAVDLNK